MSFSILSRAVLLLLLAGHWPARADEPVAEPVSNRSIMSQIGSGLVSTTQTLTHTLSDTVSGTVSLAGSVTNIAADTVRNTATGTVRVAGTVTHAVIDTAGDTVNGAVRLVDAVGTIVAGTVADAARTLITMPKDMLGYATSLIGTPYKWGGTSVSTGMDCSGFVQQVVRAATGKTLPRTAREMSKEGDQIDKSELLPGDLVFFNTRRRPFSHVGIYLGDGQFVHGASGKKSGKQIRIDKLSSSYYTKRFNGARRLSDIELD